MRFLLQRLVRAWVVLPCDLVCTDELKVVRLSFGILSPNASSPGTKRDSQTWKNGRRCMRTKSLKKKVRSKPRMCQASPPAVPVVTTLQKTIYLWASDGPPLKHHQPMHPQDRCMRPLKHFHLAAEQIYPGWSEQRPFPSAAAELQA
jgi:hypothetical protein